jgi:cytochrome c oxidase subunit 3
MELALTRLLVGGRDIDMPTLSDPQVATKLEISLSERDRNRTGSGGPVTPIDPPCETSELDPDRSATPVSAARLFTYFAMFWIVALFSTIAVVLESRWAHSKDWISIPLPRALYGNTLVLLASSVSMEFARRSVSARGAMNDAKQCARWIFVTAMLGAAFLAGQIFAWQEFGLQGVRVASNPGSFFFYLITGAHGALLLVGLAFLASVGTAIRGAGQNPRRQSGVGTIALYWHFLGVLWLCLFGLLRVTVQ